MYSHLAPAACKNVDWQLIQKSFADETKASWFYLQDMKERLKPLPVSRGVILCRYLDKVEVPSFEVVEHLVSVKDWYGVDMVGIPCPLSILVRNFSLTSGQQFAIGKVIVDKFPRSVTIDVWSLDSNRELFKYILKTHYVPSTKFESKRTLEMF